MKIEIRFRSHSAEQYDSIVDEANDALAKFKAKMQTLFPNGYIQVGIRNILGPYAQINFATNKKEEWPNGIFDNANFSTKIGFSLSNRGSDLLPAGSPMETDGSGLPKYRMKQAGIKFRKISGKNIHDALTKLYVWFEKNKDAINEMP